MFKTVRSQVKRHQGYVRRIHCLKTESSAVAVKIGIFDEVLDGLDHLHNSSNDFSVPRIYTFNTSTIYKSLDTNVEWRALYSLVRPSSTTTHLLQQGSLFQACFKHGSYTILRVDSIFLSSKLVELSLLEATCGMAVEFEIF